MTAPRSCSRSRFLSPSSSWSRSQHPAACRRSSISSSRRQSVTLHDPDHVPLGIGRPQEQPLTTTSVVIYATLLLLALTVPRGLLNWSKNFEPNPAQQLLQSFATEVQSASRLLHLDWPYARGRELFLQFTGKQDD